MQLAAVFANSVGWEVDFHVIDYFEHTDDSILEPGVWVNQSTDQRWTRWKGINTPNMALSQCQAE